MRLLPLLYSISAALCLAGCDYNHFGEPPEPDIPTWTANTTLASVDRFYRSGGTDLPQGTIVSGTVTTSDSAGNFHKILVIQQKETPLAVLTGTYDTYTAYRPGQQIILQLDGMRLGLWDGMVAVGAPEPGFPKGIDYIASDALLQKIMIHSPNPTPEPVDTLEPTVQEVTASLAGRLVRVTGHFTQGGKNLWRGEQTFSDPHGDTLQIYTSPYARFADDPLPAGEIRLTGIVTVYKGTVQIQVSSTDDIRPAAP